MLIHAICGGKIPFDDALLVNTGLLRFVGNQHNIKYEWVSSNLSKLREDQLYSIYMRFNK